MRGEVGGVKGTWVMLLQQECCLRSEAEQGQEAGGGRGHVLRLQHQDITRNIAHTRALEVKGQKPDILEVRGGSEACVCKETGVVGV